MFRDEFRPKFDVLYGISEWRDKYLDSWIAQEKQRLGQAAQVLLELEEVATKSLINYYNRPISYLEAKSITAKNVADLITANVNHVSGARVYISELLASRYSPALVRENDSIRSMPKNDNRVPGTETAFIQAFKNPATKQMVVDAALYLAIRRACKFGIEYVMEFKDGAIHYVLDGITMADVVSKAEMPINMAAQTGVPITTSELRYIFRNWYWFKDKVDQYNGLIFWRGYNRTMPPWVNEPAPWIPYAAHRVNKYRAAKQHAPDYDAANVEGFQRFAPIDPAVAIDFFGRIHMTEKLIVS